MCTLCPQSTSIQKINQTKNILHEIAFNQVQKMQKTNSLKKKSCWKRKITIFTNAIHYSCIWHFTFPRHHKKINNLFRKKSNKSNILFSNIEKWDLENQNEYEGSKTKTWKIYLFERNTHERKEHIKQTFLLSNRRLTQLLNKNRKNVADRLIWCNYPNEMTIKKLTKKLKQEENVKTSGLPISSCQK